MCQMWIVNISKLNGSLNQLIRIQNQPTDSHPKQEKRKTFR